MPVRRVNPESQGPTSFIGFSIWAIGVNVKDSEFFFERANIQLLRPGGWMLQMQLPVGLSDRFGIERAILPEPLDDAREQRPHPVALDRTVNDDGRDVKALW